MGYHTDFTGQFDLDKPLTMEHKQYLHAFNGTRRMKRDAMIAKTMADPKRLSTGLPIGKDAGFFVGVEADHGQVSDASVVEYNTPPSEQPGLWCQWTPNEDGTAIKWDGGEKFYHYTEWLEYLIQHFLGPWGYLLNGQVAWDGEDNRDQGIIHVKDNMVEAVKSTLVNHGPSWMKWQK